jgi:hypothetical protein
VATPAQRAGLLAAGFSAEAVHIADVIGAAGPLLASVEGSAGRNGAAGFNSFASNHVALSVDRAILEVQGTVSSLICQSGRIGELQDDLNQRNADINNQFAMAGIAIGAGAAVVTGGMSFFTNATIPTVTGMVAGLATVTPASGNMSIAYSVGDSSAVYASYITNKWVRDWNGMTYQNYSNSNLGTNVQSNENFYVTNFFTDEGNVTWSGAEVISSAQAQNGTLQLAQIASVTS